VALKRWQRLPDRLQNPSGKTGVKAAQPHAGLKGRRNPCSSPVLARTSRQEIIHPLGGCPAIRATGLKRLLLPVALKSHAGQGITGEAAPRLQILPLHVHH